MIAVILTLVGILAVFFLFVCFYFLGGLIRFFTQRHREAAVLRS